MRNLSVLVLSLLASAIAWPQSTGVVTGKVFDASTAQPIRGAIITVEGVTPPIATTSDTDGAFRLELPAGKVKLKVTAVNYLDASIDEVEVLAGGATEASTVMAAKGQVTTVEVNEKVGTVAANAEAMLAERKLAASVSDAISSEEIKKTVASDAAAALQKVTGVSIVENGYVYVRGLGERYSATMLNSAMIPTTEPEKRVVPLDMFPSSMIESVKIVKSYTPDLPGEFSGGLVQMSTVEFPAQAILRVSASVGANSRTTFGRFLSYPGGGRDYFGFDDGTRSLPSIVPEDRRLFQGAVPASQLQTYGRAFPKNWEPTEINSMRPSQNLSLVGGGTFKKLGMVGAISFANRPQFQSELNRYLRQGAGSPIIFSDYPDFRGYTETAKLGGVFNIAYRINANNKIVLRNTLTRDTDKEAREFSGYDGGVDTFVQSQRLRWIERGLLSIGIEGEHSLPKVANSLFRWQFTRSNSNRNEPDLREVIRGRAGDGRYVFASLSNSGFRFFNELTDKINEPQAEFSTPFFKGKVSGLFKFGFRGTLRDREFQARRFRYLPIRASTLNLYLPSNQLFAPENIRPDGFQMVEFTRATDRYDASMDIYGGYGMVDMSLGARWRIIAGLRVEDADITVRTLDPLVPNATPRLAHLANRDPIPGVNLVYALNPRQNLRFSYSHTVSRPDFRELSPFDFNNVLGGFVAQGNPDLVRATVHNYDGRWEWFPGGNQLIAASVFTKRFNSPIEMTILPANDLRQTYVNAQGATNLGFELEARRGLDVVSSKLKAFNVQVNFTFVDSNIQIRPQDATLLTSKERPMAGQSRYIVNFIGEWQQPKWHSTARFFANTVSRRLTDVGTFSLPDIYQERNTFLDFVYQYDIRENGRWSIKFSAENLGDNNYRWNQGNILQRSYQLGRTFTIGTGFNIF